ncbi:MAG: hypothetical protein KVP17_003421 [Porospora cf. gigantea B]|uniref:uncharacterized protein n=1 Tax=Porospora cf. gigantea B TaxID=2853592 RepID=UPI003571D4BD|nr:MAG: hypothetical protein KVP17_003421 [Porospora cf. gigantea B]
METWSVHTGPGNQPYFYNSESQKSLWEPPEGRYVVFVDKQKVKVFVCPEPWRPPIPPGCAHWDPTEWSRLAAQTSWLIVKTSQGPTYFYNESTHETATAATGKLAELVAAAGFVIPETDCFGAAQASVPARTEKAKTQGERLAENEAFYDLLASLSVGPNDTYKMTLPRMLHDARFKGVGKYSRKPLFDEYVEGLRASSPVDLPSSPADLAMSSVAEEAFAKKCRTLLRKDAEEARRRRAGPLRWEEAERLIESELPGDVRRRLWNKVYEAESRPVSRSRPRDRSRSRSRGRRHFDRFQCSRAEETFMELLSERVWNPCMDFSDAEPLLRRHPKWKGLNLEYSKRRSLYREFQATQSRSKQDYIYNALITAGMDFDLDLQNVRTKLQADPFLSPLPSELFEDPVCQWKAEQLEAAKADLRAFLRYYPGLLATFRAGMPLEDFLDSHLDLVTDIRWLRLKGNEAARMEELECAIRSQANLSSESKATLWQLKRDREEEREERASENPLSLRKAGEFGVSKRFTEADILDDE